jgi:aerobic carbon-monoxide dehydrogenase medium subunit
VTGFGYHRPESLEAACGLMAEFGRRARLMAGGTALTILMKEGLLDADQIVSLDRVPLGGVSWDGATLTTGATVTHQALADHPLVRAHVPMLADVLSQVASRRIRNVATIGGNLCWGEAASDPPGLLVALGADVGIRSVRGERRVAVRDLIQDYFTTILAPDEVLSEVRVPAPPTGAGLSYLKFTPQSKADKPAIAVTALVRRTDGVCVEARVVVGAAGPTPLALPAVDAELRGEALEASPSMWRAAEAYADAAQPVSDTRGSEAYKRRMIRVLVRRGLGHAWARAGDGRG